MEKADRH